MKVKDLMRAKVMTLHVDDTLDIANDIMGMGRIRHLPVVNTDDRVVGIVSQRDLFRATVSSVLGLSKEIEQEWMHSISVRNVMTPEVTTVGGETGLVEAVEKLVEAKFGSLPVVDEQGKLVGLLTETDCMRCFHNLLKMGTFKDLLS